MAFKNALLSTQKSIFYLGLSLPLFYLIERLRRGPVECSPELTVPPAF